MQPHDMAEQGLLAMPISSLINRVSRQMVNLLFVSSCSQPGMLLRPGPAAGE